MEAFYEGEVVIRGTPLIGAPIGHEVGQPLAYVLGKLFGAEATPALFANGRPWFFVLKPVAFFLSRLLPRHITSGSGGELDSEPSVIEFMCLVIERLHPR